MITNLNISIVEGTVTLPVTLAQLKAWGNIDYDSDDTLLADISLGATQDIENETALALVEKVVTVDFDALTDDVFTLPYVLAQEEITLTDEEDEAIDEDDYKLRGNKLKLLTDGSFRLTYTTANTVPAALKQAIKMLAIYRYNNRGDGDKQQGMPEDIERKIYKYRQIWL